MGEDAAAAAQALTRTEPAELRAFFSRPLGDLLDWTAELLASQPGFVEEALQELAADPDLADPVRIVASVVGHLLGRAPDVRGGPMGARDALELTFKAELWSLLGCHESSLSYPAEATPELAQAAAAVRALRRTGYDDLCAFFSQPLGALLDRTAELLASERESLAEQTLEALASVLATEYNPPIVLDEHGEGPACFKPVAAGPLHPADWARILASVAGHLGREPDVRGPTNWEGLTDPSMSAREAIELDLKTELLWRGQGEEGRHE